MVGVPELLPEIEPIIVGIAAGEGKSSTAALARRIGGNGQGWREDPRMAILGLAGLTLQLCAAGNQMRIGLKSSTAGKKLN
ncbi:MAG: hypothetical protein ABSC42_16920 [Tepidisphaeraceae bacterium]